MDDVLHLVTIQQIALEECIKKEAMRQAEEDFKEYLKRETVEK